MEPFIPVAQGRTDDTELVREQALVFANALKLREDPARSAPILNDAEGVAKTGSSTLTLNYLRPFDPHDFARALVSA